MKIKVAALCATFALLLVAFQVYAHHPFNAIYDPGKWVTVKGTVTKIEWANPHSTLWVDSKNASGQSESWSFELGGPKRLRDFGWKKDTLKMGDEVSVTGWRARDGSTKANANMVTMANGTKLNAGSSFYEAKREKAPISN